MQRWFRDTHCAKGYPADDVVSCRLFPPPSHLPPPALRGSSNPFGFNENGDLLQFIITALEPLIILKTRLKYRLFTRLLQRASPPFPPLGGGVGELTLSGVQRYNT